MNISCRSVGVPVPNITWVINNRTNEFIQTDTYKDTIISRDPTDLSPDTIMSTLHIVNASYPDHDGVYFCTGTNNLTSPVASSSAYITVQVHGKYSKLS